MSLKSLIIKMLAVFCGIFLTFSVAAQTRTFQYQNSKGKTGVSLLYQDEKSVVLQFSISEFSLTSLNIEGEVCENVELTGNFLPNEAGKPNLPSIGRYIALPQDADVEIEIVDQTTEKVKNVNIAPAPEIPLDTDKKMRCSKDAFTYAKNVYYPEKIVRISPVSQIRGVDAVLIGISPFQYNPAKKDLKVYRELTIKISFKNGNGHFGRDEYRSIWWDEILSNTFVNANSLPKINYSRQAANFSKATGCEYLIITPNAPEFQQWADTIKRFRNQQGILTKIVTLSEIGNNTSAAIESYVNNAYNTWNIKPSAILLLGDHGSDASNSIVSTTLNNHPGGYNPYISDNPYADVSGDGVPEIAFSRITARNANELAIMINKFINYEKHPPLNPNFYDHPISALGWQTERWFQLCSEIVRGFWQNVLGKHPVRINAVYEGNPETDPWSTAPNTSAIISYFGPYGLQYIPANPSALGGFTGGTPTQITQAINDGAFILQHRDHGFEEGWGEPAYTNQNISSLTNTDLTFIMSVNCLTGKFNAAIECFAEKFHRFSGNGQGKGALGIIAASETSYSFVNDVYVWGMYDYLFPNFMPAQGTTSESRCILPAFGNVAGKIFLQSSNWPYNTGQKPITYNLFHHHGDGFLMVYSEVPQNLTVTCDPILNVTDSILTVSANVGALVAISLNSEIIGRDIATGNPMEIPLNKIYQAQDTLLLTITKQNYFRYTKKIPVQNLSTAYCYVSQYVMNDSLLGNNNEKIDYNETVLLNLSVKNAGVINSVGTKATILTSNPYIEIIDGTEVFNNIAAQSTILKTDAFKFKVSPNIPDQTEIIFNVEISDTTQVGLTWQNEIRFVANAPVFSFEDYTVETSSGNLTSGETSHIKVFLKNIGHSTVSNFEAIAYSLSPNLSFEQSSFPSTNLSPQNSVELDFIVKVKDSVLTGTESKMLIRINNENALFFDNEHIFYINGTPEVLLNNNNTENLAVSKYYFYDSGGKDSEYGNNETFVKTFSAPAGYKLQVTFFGFNTVANKDRLYAFDGNNTGAAGFAGSPFSGTTIPASFTSSGNSITFMFTSDASASRRGWEAEIILIPATPQGGNIAANDSMLCRSGKTSLILADYIGNIQWQTSTDNQNFTDISQGIGKNSEVYYTETLNEKTYFRAKLNVESQVAYSNVVEIGINTILPVPGTAMLNGNFAVCQNDSVTIHLTNFVGEIQWVQATDSTQTFNNVANNGNSDIYVSEKLTNSMFYKAKVSSGGCGFLYSNVIEIIVNPAPQTGKTTISDTLLCAGNNATLKIVQSTGNIQWQFARFSNPTNFINISNATTSEFTTNNLDSSMIFRAKLKLNDCISYSNLVSAKVNLAILAGEVFAEKSVVCKNTSTKIALRNFYGSKIQWQKSNIPDGNFGNLSGENDTIFETAPMNQDAYYRVKVSQTGKGCVDVFSNIASVKMNVAPSVKKVANISFPADSAIVLRLNDLVTEDMAEKVRWAFSASENLKYVLDTVANKITILAKDTTFNGKDSIKFTATDACGLSDFEFESFTVTIPVSISEIENREFANIYPNPVRNIFEISVKEKYSGNISVQIFNVTGTLVYSQSFENQSVMKVNIENLPQGIYSVLLKTSKTQKTFKILKQ